MRIVHVKNYLPLMLLGYQGTFLSNQGEEVKKAFVSHTSPGKVSYLKDAGFDVLNVANNHIMDLGEEGREAVKVMEMIVKKLKEKYGDKIE